MKIQLDETEYEQLLYAVESMRSMIVDLRTERRRAEEEICQLRQQADQLHATNGRVSHQ